MKGRSLFFAILATFSLNISANSKINDQPKNYQFSYKIKNNEKIDESSVCHQYGGIEWKECRRYAQWVFSEKCWNLRYKIKHTTGDLRRQIRKEIEFYCDAKKVVTPLK